MMGVKLKRLGALLLALILAVGCAPAVSAKPAATAAPGALHVSGTKLVDAGGKAVQLRGVSTHGLAWFPQYVNQGCFNDLRSWGANVVRLAMYTAEYGGYCTGGDQNDLKALVRSGVKYAANAGMYVIIDWHILSDGNPNTYVNQAKAFFQEMSAEFAGYDNVLYEICNEPNGGTTWAQIKAYAQQIIPVIRANDPDAVIIVGTPTWSQEVDKAAADPITGYDNIMYALHFYAATHQDGLRQTMVNAIKAGLPVFVTEYGICDASGSGALNIGQADKWVSVMDQYGVSYVNWNLSNKAESSSMLKSSCGKTGGFTVDDLSDSGRWLYDMLRSKAGSAAPEDPGVAGFRDVKATDWFAPCVEYVAEHDLMKGTSGTAFSPGGNVTRAQVMTILGRLAGADVDGGSPWYQKAMDWGVAQGVTDGTNPGGDVTREQFAALLYRFADYPASDPSVLGRFPDAASIHDWTNFRAAMAWAVEKGVITGTADNRLNPQGNATRAEAAAMLMRFCKLPRGGGLTVTVTQSGNS